ncbi:MAG: hypothetical protein DHS20C16_17110 [Phycisphaerae bacterium]|nr:MAG: hypothetical protein DHS20C16_17110 [Phycisphaerae bacterium]
MTGPHDGPVECSGHTDAGDAPDDIKGRSEQLQTNADATGTLQKDAHENHATK